MSSLPYSPNEQLLSSSPVKPTRVLIVEDEQVARRALASLLRSCGFTIEAVGSAEAALQVLSDGHQPDVALVDVDLPQMNGMEFIEYLHAHLPAVYGVLITASDPERVQALIDQGVPHLRKPLDFRALLAILMRLQKPH